MTTHKEFMAKLMKKPGFKEAYEKHQPEFKIYTTLIKARTTKGLTQKQLAQKMGIAQSALARFESGRTNPTWAFLKKVIEGLGLKIAIF